MRLPWFGRKTNDIEGKSLASPEVWLSEMFAGGAAFKVASNVTVSPRTAMRCMPVRAAVETISETIGCLPLHIYKRNADGSKARDTQHPAQALLHDAANPWTPATLLREHVTRDALLHPFGGFAMIIRNTDGKPVELIRLDPEITPVTVKLVNYEPVYEVADNGIVPRQNILHIPTPGLTGSGLVQDGREAIGLAIVMEQHAARLFGNGARPGGLLAFKGNMNADALAKAKAAWQAAHGGGAGGGTAVMPGDATWTGLTLNSVDAQFLELRKFAVEEIARLYRVPPTFLAEYGRATWANSEAMRRDFIDLSLKRWLAAWEGEVFLKLLTPEEQKSYFAEFLLDDFLKGDVTARYTAYNQAIASRIFSPNEIRAMENYPPYAGGEKYENPNTSRGVPPEPNIGEGAANG